MDGAASSRPFHDGCWVNIGIIRDLEPVIRKKHLKNLLAWIGKIFLIDLFVVDYSMDGQRELALHEDTSLLSFSY